ncbi:MAG: filamentous hemagglutinin N-terminal domain-containing protein, partial [Verrucomicrobiota bacterium]
MRTHLSSLRRNLTIQILILATLFPGLIHFPTAVHANPRGANVVAGNVNISGLGTRRVDIIQNSNRAIINWQQFNIQKGEITQFRQRGGGTALNRVVTGDPTAIYGQLRANGSVVLINPNGIVVGPSGTVDVAGMLTMSTLDTTNEDFLNGGRARYKGNTAAGVVNYGAISSATGDVVLLGNFLQNSGSVSAPQGTVAFGAGGEILVNETASGGKISVIAGGVGGATGISNSGSIDGAAAELKAHGNVYALAIQNDGVVRASGYNFSGGRLTLSAGPQGSIVNTGQLIARNSDGSGGRIDIDANNISLDAGTVDVSGAPGMQGGEVNVTGNGVEVAAATSIAADGSVGGSVRVSGQRLAAVDGAISATGDVGNGGFIDVSASEVTVGSTASMDVSGVTEGGRVRVGGGFQGNEADINNSNSTAIDAGASFFADAIGGDAGTIVIWSDGDTLFRGEASAQAFGAFGDGGLIEISGRQNLTYDGGHVSTRSANGNTGTLLFDPVDVEISRVASGTATITIEALFGAAPGTDGWNNPSTVGGLIHDNHVVIHTSGDGGEGDIT